MPVPMNVSMREYGSSGHTSDSRSGIRTPETSISGAEGVVRSCPHPKRRAATAASIAGKTLRWIVASGERFIRNLL